jgi:uncharacterized protein
MRLEIKRKLYISIGVLSLIIGVIGIPLPLLPTTPFLLLSAFCFSRGSDKFHHWLVNHRVFGPPIRDWRNTQSIGLEVKLMSTAMMLMGYGFMLWYEGTPILAKYGYPILVLPALVFIWTRKSR